MNREIMERLAPMFAELEQASNKRLAEAAKADPLQHKMTRVFDPGVNTNFRYYGPVKNGKGQKVMFCYSIHRNAAGFFLGWRETHMKNGAVKRDHWVSRRIKARCIEIARDQHERTRATGERP